MTSVLRAADPERLEWPSYLNAAFGRLDQVYRDLLTLNVEGANRWRVAMLASEWALSDGYFDDHDKWIARADAIETRVRQGRY
jgi:hypothetical protein